MSHDDTPSSGYVRPTPLGSGDAEPVTAQMRTFESAATDPVTSEIAVVRARHADSTGTTRPRSDRRRGRGRRRIGGVVLAAVVLVAGYYAVTFVQVVQTGRDHEADPADVIVVLGAAQYDGRPSPQLGARLDHAVTLYARGDAPFLMVTGGNQPGDRFTEAEAGRRYLEERGVPASAILSEDVGRTTFESLQSAAIQLESDGLTNVVLVTDPFHSLRSRLIAEEVGLSADVASTPTSVVSGWGSLRRHLFEAGGVAVGRVISFERLSGFSG